MEEELFKFIERYMTLSEDEKKAISDLAIFRSFKKGTVLLREGDFSKDAYFVLKGCLRSYYLRDGEEKTTAFFTELESFAPPCSINQLPSDLFVACVEDCILTVSNPEMEKNIFERFPRFESLCRVLSEELLMKNQVSFAEFKSMTPEERYLNLVRTRPDLIQRVPQFQLASFLGMTPESLSRIRKRTSKLQP